MGGRKSYKSKNYVGNSKDDQKSFKTLGKALDESKLKEVKNSAIDVLSDSDKLLDYYSDSLYLSAEIPSNIGSLLEIKDESILKIEVSKQTNHKNCHIQSKVDLNKQNCSHEILVHAFKNK